MYEIAHPILAAMVCVRNVPHCGVIVNFVSVHATIGLLYWMCVLKADALPLPMYKRQVSYTSSSVLCNSSTPYRASRMADVAISQTAG